jgi:hypothetical protein
MKELSFMNRSYLELIELKTFEDRFDYLRLDGVVGAETFGSSRQLNQALYRSYEWKKIRDMIILRDNGCDLGIEGRDIFQQPYIHHLNPITKKQILDRDPILFDPNNLITVSYQTHQAIHYGDKSILLLDPIERFANDVAPWRI